jgi:putative chitinase
MGFDVSVLQLQTNLARLGYTPGRLDGWWGKNTAEATVDAALFLGLPDALTDGLAVAIANRVEEIRATVTPLNVDEFRELFPRSKYDSVDDLNAALVEGCLTKKRAAAFLAQLGHESGGLQYWVELASGEAYEFRRTLGNTKKGDGPRYRGRSPIQLTGRANFTRFGAMLGVDLVNHPERASDPDVGFRIAVAYWTDHNLNTMADLNDFRGITREINGGYNGWKDRLRWWRKIKNVWGV